MLLTCLSLTKVSQSAHLVLVQRSQEGVALLGGASPPYPQNAVLAPADNAAAVGCALDGCHLQATPLLSGP